nr:MAG TPA: Prokaryotic membrane lipoprotein lipid attachment site [Caudoviricetes sp.]
MSMRKILFAIMMVLFLAGCEESPVKGYVVGKRFIPAHTTTQYNVVLKRPTTTHHSDEWVVWVADSCHIHRVHVDKSTFERLNHGEYVTSKGTYYGKEESN